MFGPAQSPLLTFEETQAIMVSISLDDIAPRLPEGFCTQRFSRAQSTKTTHSTSMGLPGDGESSSSTLQNTSSVLSTVEANSTNPGNLFSSSRRIVMGNRRKYYCTRSISSTNCYNSGVLRHSVKFSVDKNICVMGIQVPTQNSRMSSEFLKMVWKDLECYRENICVQFLNCRGTKLAHKRLTDPQMMSDTLVELNFVRPVYIQKHKVYQIVVEFSGQTGHYSVGTSIRDEERCDSVTFTFDRDNTSIYDGLIKSIIFTY